MASKLKFYSWMQKGLSLGITNQADASGSPTQSESNIDVGIRLKDSGTQISHNFNLRGPGDVVGIDTNQIIRTQPKPHVRDFEPNFFPFVDFLSPDLPWLFSPVTPGPEERIRPWLGLVVIDQTQDHSVRTQGTASNPILKINSSASQILPPMEEMFAWSHVQYNGSDKGTLDELIQSSPGALISRSICPIKLKKETGYLACLVPLFEAGRRAGLGMEIGDAGLSPAWDNAISSIELPVYYSWTFSTGLADFEALARRLKPYEADETVGLHDMDIGHPRGGLDLNLMGPKFSDRKRLLVSFEGALASPIAQPRDWLEKHRKIFQKKLKTILSSGNTLPQSSGKYDPLTQDPVVSPPLYGKWQSGATLTTSREPLPDWLDETNFNAEHRAVAGVANKTVRKHQEEFMAEAWEFARNARAAQRELRHSRLALAVSGQMHSKFKKLKKESWLQLTSATHKRIKLSSETKATNSVFSAINKSNYVPGGLTDAGFRRLGRNQQKKINKALPQTNRTGFSVFQAITKSVVLEKANISKLASFTQPVRLNYEKSYSAESAKSNSSSKSKVSKKAGKQSAGSAAAAKAFNPINLDRSQSFDAVSKLQLIPIEAKTLAEVKVKPVDVDIDLNAIIQTTKGLVDPATTIPKLIFTRVKGIEPPPVSAVKIPKFANVEMEFDEPGYLKLQQLNPELFLPGFGNIPQNTVSIMQVNPKFIESYLLGLNHEMSREFAWREYPTLLNNTWFKKFWDYVGNPETRDITDIKKWGADTRLGRHQPGSGKKKNEIVLLIKGDLLRRYPNTIIYAAKASWAKRKDIKGSAWEKADARGTPMNDWTRIALLEDPKNIKLPVFKGKIGTEAHFLGFDLSVKQVLGSTKVSDLDAGWFFVFEEHLTEPRFGLDSPTPKTNFGVNPGTINNLSWGHMVEERGTLGGLGFAQLDVGWNNKIIEGVEWGKNSSEMARLCYQSPVRLMFHADGLIGEKDGDQA